MVGEQRKGRRGGNIVARLVEEAVAAEADAVDAVIRRCLRGRVTGADKAVVARWLATAEARARAGQAA